MEIYIVEADYMTVRAFSDRAKAEQYVQCLKEEWDDELDEPRYFGYEFEIIPVYLEK